jgi:16S rRNA G527 N7-methylase RsmG
LSTDWRSALAACARSSALPWQDDWRAVLESLQQLAAAGNARTNLVGDASPAGVSRHVVEALTVAAAVEQQLGRTPSSVVDVGAGAGLEAIVLAIAWPSAQVVAVEPRALRHEFIAATVAELGLRNLLVRGASLHGARLAPVFELATARAVWPPPEWLSRARGLLAPAGVVALHVKADFSAVPKGWRELGRRVVPEMTDSAPVARGNLIVLAEPTDARP